MRPDPDGRWAVVARGQVPGVPDARWESLSPTIYRSFAQALAVASGLDDALVYQLELVAVHRG